MPQLLPFGSASTLQLEIPPETLIADGTGVAGPIVDDPRVAVEAALREPLGYPPLAQGVVPGDRVVIPIDPGVPQGPQVVAGIVHTLLQAGVNPDDVVVLTTRLADGSATWDRELGAVSDAARFVVHDPQDQAGLCYLAASKKAEPIYLNRHLCEADVIVPVNLLRPRSALGFLGGHGGLFPHFADTAAQQRFRVPTSATCEHEQRLRRAEVDEVAWLLGLQLTVQVVPGIGSTVLHVLAGCSPPVTERGYVLAEAAWSREVTQRAQLVVAGIAGGCHEQTWENFGRALYTASQVCTDDGTIVLCTELVSGLGPALRRLTRGDEDPQLSRRLQHDRSEDALSASLLLENRQRQHIFLLSGLDNGTVESLGVGYIAEAAEINRLSRRADSCIVLADAHRAVWNTTVPAAPI